MENEINKTVLITGGSRGIGRKTAQIFAENGYQVVFTYRNNHQAAALTLNSLKGKEHCSIPMDLTNPVDTENQFREIIRRYPKIDALVNNAGIFVDHDIATITYEEWQRAWQKTIETNLTGLANITFLVAKEMISQSGGVIINVSSRGAFRGEPDHPAYGASKGGLNSFSQSMAKKLGKYGISVIAVAPGFVDTDMAKPILQSSLGELIKTESPLGRVARPTEVAQLIYTLSQEENQFLTGGIIDINGASYLRM